MNDTNLLEKILIEHGRIIDYQILSSYFADLSNVNNKISSLIEKGWLVNLKKGVYYITKLGSLGSITISNYVIAGIIGKKSFVSFEGALKYHGLFDQGIKKYRSISKIQYLGRQLEGIKYDYIAVLKESYFGFKDADIENENARIATIERALLDLIEYQRNIYSVSLVIEKFQNYQDSIDLNLLIDYLSKYSQVTIKMIGVILDLLSIKSDKVKTLVSGKSSTSRLFKTSDKFNAKWRIYYDPILEEQLS